MHSRLWSEITLLQNHHVLLLYLIISVLIAIKWLTTLHTNEFMWTFTPHFNAFVLVMTETTRLHAQENEQCSVNLQGLKIRNIANFDKIDKFDKINEIKSASLLKLLNC